MLIIGHPPLGKLRSGVLSPATMFRVICLYRSLCEDGLVLSESCSLKLKHPRHQEPRS